MKKDKISNTDARDINHQVDLENQVVDATEAASQSTQANQSDQTTHSKQPAVSNQSDASQPDAAMLDLLGDLQRTRADFENYRKQVEGQKSLVMSAAKYATVEKFLPLVDDFERALTAYPEQLAPLRKNFDKTLSALGLTQIDSAPGAEFNPDLHEAISVEGDEGDIEVIAETLRPGYIYDGSVIRAAMVKVKHK